MNLLRDLKKQYNDKKKQESAVAQLRKRSKESIARPRAEKNILAKSKELQGIWYVKKTMEEGQKISIKEL